MKYKTIIDNHNEKTLSKKILMFDDVSDVRILSNNIAWKIIELLSHKAMYPAQIAKELKLPLGTVKAHIFRGRELLNKFLKDKIKNY